MSKFSHKDQILRWLRSHQEQDPSTTFWTLYRGPEVKASEIMHKNRTITDAAKSNALLIDTIMDLRAYACDLTIHLTNKENSSAGFKGYVYLMPESTAVAAQQPNYISGINGVSSDEVIEKEVARRLELAQLKAEIKGLSAMNSTWGRYVDKYLEHPNFNPDTGLNFIGSLLHRGINLIEKALGGEPQIAIAGLDKEEKSNNFPKFKNMPEKELVQSDSIEKPDVFKNLIRLQKIIGNDISVELLLDALCSYMENNELTVPMIKAQIAPYIKNGKI